MLSAFYDFQLDIIRAIQGIASDGLTMIVEIITMIGEEYIALLVMAVIYFFFNKKMAQKMLFVIAGSMSFNSIVKNIVKEPRPYEMANDIVNYRQAGGYSFPSGHSQLTATFLHTSAQELYNAKKIKWPFVVSAILTILVMFTRMYLGQHFLIDVVCGALLGLGLAILLGYLYDKYSADGKELLLINIIVLIGVPFFIYFLLTITQNQEKGYDFFKNYGMLFGLPFAILIEKKYSNFGYDVSIFKKILRLVGALVVILAVKEGLGAAFKAIGNACVAQGDWGHIVFALLHFLRYSLMVIVGMGCYPILIKKLKF